MACFGVIVLGFGSQHHRAPARLNPHHLQAIEWPPTRWQRHAGAYLAVTGVTVTRSLRRATISVTCSTRKGCAARVAMQRPLA